MFPPFNNYLIDNMIVISQYEEETCHFFVWINGQTGLNNKMLSQLCECFCLAGRYILTQIFPLTQLQQMFQFVLQGNDYIGLPESMVAIISMDFFCFLQL
jgi:hypothetical protein